MSKIYIKNYNAPVIDVNEVLRYAGVRDAAKAEQDQSCSLGQDSDRGIRDILDDVIRETLPVLRYSVCYRFVGDSVLFAATVGDGIEKLYALYADSDPVRALLVTSFGSERVEALCDEFCSDMGLSNRVSPGYGSWKLEEQKAVFELLDPEKNIGVSLGDDFFMHPVKSVTAKGKFTFRSELNCCRNRMGEKRLLIFDGGLGSLLQKRGLTSGERPEKWNLTWPDVISSIHEEYYTAGADIVLTNTFGVNGLKYSGQALTDIVEAALYNACSVRNHFNEGKDCADRKYVAFDLGPLGKMLKPFGDLEFEDAVEAFARAVRAAVSVPEDIRPDLVVIETITDSYETKAAVLAVKENCDLPLIVSNAYMEGGKLLTGASPRAMIALLEGLGVDAIGMNCSMGPSQLYPLLKEYLNMTSLPILFMPNAGMPVIRDNTTCYDISPDDFASQVAAAVDEGVILAGGCCGTTPEYIALLKKKTSEKDFGKACIPCPKRRTVVSSYSKSVCFDEGFVKVGERINPTGKPKLKKALIDEDVTFILEEGQKQAAKGADVLDVNVGIPQIDEKKVLPRIISEIQAVTNVPLQIDTSDPEAMEQAVRLYNGKPMLNSVNAAEKSMNTVFPIAKKYGAVVVALTLDENGIPDTAEGRVRLARKIVERGVKFGINKEDIIFDTLAMAVSAQSDAGVITIEAMERINRELGCKTILGISNISFGLPGRPAVNAAFLGMGREAGLSAAILNPFSQPVMDAACCSIQELEAKGIIGREARKLLEGKDAGCREYLAAATDIQEESLGEMTPETPEESLRQSIIRGLSSKTKILTENLLEKLDQMTIINTIVIPALDRVGTEFEAGKIYLPQLLMSAEAANNALILIKASMPKGEKNSSKKTIILATVKGDIHDIGKNIVRLLLDSYGYDVIDLGKDVEAEEICRKAEGIRPFAVGLSALMTTTVPAMEESIKLIRKRVPETMIIVGGAVLNQEMADRIGADMYSADAMETVRYVESALK